MARKGKTLRRKCRLQHLAVVGHKLEGQHIQRQAQLSYQIRKLIGRDPTVDDGMADRNFPQRRVRHAPPSEQP